MSRYISEHRNRGQKKPQKWTVRQAVNPDDSANEEKIKRRLLRSPEGQRLHDHWWLLQQQRPQPAQCNR
eukprot:CAMPEP_0174326994 /NCGR_PEP_ID=MMETSP0810-20121108/14245_1 /TAXON_ID=73025 ORGANISM="Eutreptiella gymnastica-like, Strain CCMP1594" /NCGR_SAMPLE_ID=MMETSP0810 /ASSEMBLY_ACC=CAM_ASM_000659 /LENGTH=68 /DNA_ID=CAMNT_0015440741 /DNA_START=347 /DNA_END=553 /DNA_ORIENTATION=-